MGLDQYAYVASRAGQRGEFYKTGTFVNGHFVSTVVSKPRELAYWRKHPNLQGWMNKLWESKGCPNAFSEDDPLYFNQVEVELTWDDVHQLENDIKSGEMSKLDTKGVFFGNPSDDHYYEYDLEFCRSAKAELFIGLKVFYTSSW